MTKNFKCQGKVEKFIYFSLLKVKMTKENGVFFSNDVSKYLLKEEGNQSKVRNRFQLKNWQKKNQLLIKGRLFKENEKIGKFVYSFITPSNSS